MESVAAAMSVAVFLVLHAVKGLSSPYDCYWLCVYVGLDSITWALLWIIRRRNRP